MGFSTYTTKTKEEIFIGFDTSTKGLGEEEAVRRQEKYGQNKIAVEEVAWWHILGRQFKFSFVYLLLVAAGVSFILGGRIDALMILLFVAINACLGFYQEFRAEETFKLLKKHFSGEARVLRNGKKIIIKAVDLVPGDFIILQAGDIIPADVRFISENNLVVDESILTGESEPQEKISDKLESETNEIYEASNIGFSSTVVLSGKAQAIVLNIGSETVIGGIAHLAGITARESSFAKGVAKVSRFILRLVLISILFVFLTHLFLHQGATRSIGDFLIFSIALAVSVIPEALPVVTTVSLSRGALRLAKNGVVVKRLSAIEDLGGIEVLCSDKTGTLTENKLTVDEINSPNKEECLFKAALASFSFGEEGQLDAFDRALSEVLPLGKKEELKKYQKINEIPFDPARRRNSVLVKKDGLYELIVRGAPEFLIDSCINLEEDEKKTLKEWLVKEGERGRRVLAIAKNDFKKDHYDIKEEEKDLSFLGIISFIDPLKKDAKKTIKLAERLGVKVKILTGDSAEVAGSVAYQVGLTDREEEVLLGKELEKMTEEAQEEAVEKYSVFARVSPSEKYKIIKLLQKKYEVGFLGEGINDAPALKIANVALVVKGSADIAREAADVILLKRNLAIIIEGIREGREVFANTVKYIKATLISNFGNFYALVAASLLIDFLPMLPLQILLLNLFSDFPMVSISTDNIDEEELKRPETYNLKEIVLAATIFGFISSIFDFIIFRLFVHFPPGVLQTNWFIGSVLTELVLVFSIRTKFSCFKAKRASKFLIWLSILITTLTIVLPFSHFGQDLFKFVRPQTTHLIWIFVVVVCYFVATETMKILFYRHSNQTKKRLNKLTI